MPGWHELAKRLRVGIFRRREAEDFDVARARLKFAAAYQAWVSNEKKPRFLLNARDLRLLERFEEQLHEEPEEDEKRYFLDLSQRRRRLDRIIFSVIVLYVVSAACLAALQYGRAECRSYLRESGYPPELCDWQDQLKVLKLRQPLDLSNFSWLRSKTIENLEIRAEPRSDSIAGLSSLAKCSSLKKFTLILDGSRVRDLRPLEKLRGLTQLTLSLGSEVGDLKPLEQLSGLTWLDLDLSNSKVSDLRPLAKLSALTSLRVRFSGEACDLQPLANLQALSTLGLDSIKAADLGPLEKLHGLAELSVDLRDARAGDLELLEKVGRLTELDLNLGGSNLRDLRALERLSGLTRLKLRLGRSEVRELSSLENLHGLTNLSLDLSESVVSDVHPLEKLSGLTQLDLDLRNSEVSDVQPLEKLSGLTRLSIVLTTCKVTDLSLLGKLSGLSRLTVDLRGSYVYDLSPLEELSRLTHLDLDLTFTGTRNLAPLEKLNGLTQLTLKHNLTILSDSPRIVKKLESVGGPTKLALNAGYGDVWHELRQLEKLSGLNQLSLDLDFREAEGSYLQPLEKLRGLSELTLRYSKTQLSGLMLLEKLKFLRILSLDGTTRAQRMSLHGIPASLTQIEF